jgi:glc operon protein GlcG
MRLHPILLVLPLLFTPAPLKAQAINPGLSLASARQLSENAFRCAKEKGIFIAVAIVNAEGNLVLFERHEQAYPGSIEASIEKAKSANAFRRSTSDFAQSLKEGRLDLLTLKGIVAIAGGVPIKTAQDTFIGAIGISGGRSSEDNDCALASIATLK